MTREELAKWLEEAVNYCLDERECVDYNSLATYVQKMVLEAKLRELNMLVLNHDYVIIRREQLQTQLDEMDEGE